MRNKFLIEQLIEKPNDPSNSISFALESVEVLSESKVDQEDTDAALDMSVALDDLHVVIGSIDKPSVIDSALIQCIANTAVSGTDMNARQVLPSMKSLNTKQVFVEALSQRSLDVLNFFLHQLSSKFYNLETYVKSASAVLRDNKATIAGLIDKFPIPGGDNEDVPRTIEVTLQDCQFLITPIGVALTQGDIINALNKTIEDFKRFNQVALPTSNRLFQTVREVIPQKKVSSAIELLETTKYSNTSLYLTIMDLWTNMISISNLNSSRGDNGQTVVGTAKLLGGQHLSLRLTVDNASSVKTLTDRSNIIRSFCVVLQNDAGFTVPNQKVTLTGITNTGLRSIITKINDFITDIEKYAAWPAVSAQSAQVQCESDVATINNFLSQNANGELTEQEAQDYKIYLQTHIGDINSVVKNIDLLSTLPLSYTTKLVSDFIVLLSTISSDSPLGAYNAL